MQIIHLATEIAPLAKVGGLGDVITGLSKTLIDQNHSVMVILPRYATIDESLISPLQAICSNQALVVGETSIRYNIWKSTYKKIPLILIDIPQYFNLPHIYGEKNDTIRFTTFVKIALTYLLDFYDHNIDILNIHDWLTAVAVPLYQSFFNPKGLKIKKIVMTIHNMAYQGICKSHELSQLGIPIQSLSYMDHTPNKTVNLLKGAIIQADEIITVSPSYAKEIQGSYGCGLSTTINAHSNKLTGILNGIDTCYWDPHTDPYLQHNYLSNSKHITSLLKAKAKNRQHLQQSLQMAPPHSMLCVCITRLVEQKGPHFIRWGIEYILKRGGQCILIGSAHSPRLIHIFENLRKRYETNPHVYFHFGFNEELAHQAFSAADCTLIPSKFEPCGLTQMIALRYGAIPIARTVGGLKDTVLENAKDKTTGYEIQTPTRKALYAAIDRAYYDYSSNALQWQSTIKNGLDIDWSWRKSSTEYIKIYSR